MLLFQSKRSEEGFMQPGPGEDVLHLDPRRIADCHKFYKMGRTDFVGGCIDKI